MNYAFIHLFINPFKHLSSAYYVPCTILCAGYIALNKTKTSCPPEACLFIVHSNGVQINNLWEKKNKTL